MSHPWRLLFALIYLTACSPSGAHIPPPPTTSPVSISHPTAPRPIMVTQPRTSASSFQSGISLLIYGNDVSYQREATILFDQLATDNINSLSIVVPIFQSGFYGISVFADPIATPSNEELAWLIQAAKARGFSVMLRPLIDERTLDQVPGGWRGIIQPTSVVDWFVSYESVILSYATLAQNQGVDALDIGSELSSMEPYIYYWQSLISHARAIYSGALTYASNFDTSALGFGSLLDFISVDAYYPVSAAAEPSVAEIVAGWKTNGLPDLLRRSALAGKPIVVTEVGVWPARGVFLHPYAGSAGPYSPLAQQNFYNGTCAALKPHVSGIYWWYVGLTQQPLPPTISGHDPLSVPGTELAIANCYAPDLRYPPSPPLQSHHVNND